MSSLSEAKAQKYIEEAGQDFVDFNKKHLCRIYPGAKRTDSSNFKPTPFWNVGCQMGILFETFNNKFKNLPSYRI